MTSAPNPVSAKWSDLGIRSLSAIALVPLVLLVVWAGAAWFTALVALVAVVIAYEWSNAAFKGDALQFALLALAGIAGAFFPAALGTSTALVCVVVISIVSILAAQARGYAGFWTRCGALYAGLPAVALSSLRGSTEDGAKLILWILVIVWAMDILAYFFGRTIGGPKLAPALSPKKTWSGLGGAVLGAALTSWVFSYFALGKPVIPLIMLAGFLAIVEQGGDIFESAFKRRYGIKDSSNLILGHGGMMDRVDGLIAVAVAVFCVGLLRNSGDLVSGLFNW